MALEKICHYAITNHATIYNEEGLTSLELAGRTAAKVNECVDAFNQLHDETVEHLDLQDMEISERLGVQDERITIMNDVTMPSKVDSEIQERIDDGSFDKSIDAYLNNLSDRLDNLLGQVTKGSTSGDAELIDIRLDAEGTVHTSAGEAVRSLGRRMKLKNQFTGYRAGGYIAQGNWTELSGWGEINPIKFKGGKLYFYVCPTESGIIVPPNISVFNLYDGDKNWIGRFSAQLNHFTPIVTELPESEWKNGRMSWMTEIELPATGYSYVSFYTNEHWLNNTADNEMIIYIDDPNGNYELAGKIPVSSIYFDTTIEEKHISGENVNPWNGKTWFAFGTSITDTSYTNAETGEVTGKYVPYLCEMSGLNVNNQGIAGGTIGSGGTHGGSSNILERILSTDISNADLITIEGFVNDFACGVSLGEIGDTENTTMCGALYQAISYCLQNSHATVVLLTESYGKEYTLKSTGTTANYTVSRKNALGLLQKDYNDVIIKMGSYMGVPVIDCGGKSHITNFHPEYIIDQIHHSDLGGQQYAKTVWSELKNLKPLSVQ